MKKIIAFALLIISSLNLSYAQKDAPVIGHATMLVDLLKKDYGSIGSESVDDELVRDRRAVIGIFKAYLPAGVLNNRIVSDYSDNMKEAEKSSERYEVYKKQLDNYSAVPTGVKLPTDLKNYNTEIKTIVDEVNKHKKLKYAYRSMADSLELLDLEEIYEDLTIDNKYLGYMVAMFGAKYKAIADRDVDQYAVINSNSSIQKGIPFIGGDQALKLVMNEFAEFIAKRIKEELTAYVLDRVRLWLQNPGPDDPLAELKVLLPKTTNYFVGFTPDKAMNFQTEIREYIGQDIKGVLMNLPNLKNTPRIQNLISKHPELDFALEGLEMIPQLSKIKYPIDYFTLLEQSRNVIRWKNDSDQTKQDVSNSIHLAALLARSMVMIDNGEPRIAGLDYLGAYISDLNFYLLYAGFLNQQNTKYYDITLKNTINITASLKALVAIDPAAADLTAKKNTLRDIITKTTQNAEKIYQTGLDVRKANNEKKEIGPDTIYKFVNNIIDFSKDAIQSTDDLIGMITSTSYVSSSPTITQYFSLATTTNDAILNIQKKNYSTALLNILEISTSLIRDDDYLSALSKSIQNISNIRNDQVLQSWSTLFKALQQDGATIGEKERIALGIVASELSKIDLYYKTAFRSSTSNVKVTELISFFKTLKIGNLNKVPDGLKNLGTDRVFRELLLSYYSNINLHELLTPLSQKLQAYEVTRNGAQIKVFSPDDEIAISNMLINYAEAVFKNYFIYGNKQEEIELIKSKREVYSFLASYLSTMPQKFSIGANTNVVSLIHFVSEMAAAKSSDDVEKAIEALVLPSGSYTIKRASVFNFAINSYPGILGGYEVSWKDNTTLKSPGLGFTAPVGLNFSWGGPKGGTDGIFIPVFDLGALTRLRLDDSSATETLPEFSFKNIFSPGVYYTHGFRKSPLAVNLGLQYGPELKEISVVNNVSTSKSYESVRFGIGLVLDIPLFNLNTRPR